MKRANSKQDNNVRSKKKRKLNDGETQPNEIPDEGPESGEEEPTPIETAPITEQGPTTGPQPPDSAPATTGAPTTLAPPTTPTQPKLAYPYPYYPVPAYPFQPDCAQCQFEYYNYLALWYQRMAASVAYQAHQQQYQHSGHHMGDKPKPAGEKEHETSEGDTRVPADHTAPTEHREAMPSNASVPSVSVNVGADQSVDSSTIPPPSAPPPMPPPQMPIGVPGVPPVPIQMTSIGLVSPTSEQKQRGPRRPYLCSKCGRPKKGHACSATAAAPSLSADKQVGEGEKGPRPEGESGKQDDKSGEVIPTFDGVDNELHEIEKHLQQS